MKGILLFALSSLLVPGLVAENVDIIRNLDVYERTDPVEFGPDDPEPQTLESRRFLWEHWTARRRANLEFIYVDREGNRFRRNWFVTPDYNGEWVVLFAKEFPYGKTMIYDRVEIGTRLEDGTFVVSEENVELSTRDMQLRLLNTRTGSSRVL